MKVTVAINSYNYQSFIEEAINSVLNQSYNNIQVIIIDDGSTDNTLEVIRKKYAKQDSIKIISKSNGGQLSTFNWLLKVITGDIVFFLDADDVYKQNYINEVVAIYKRNPDIDFVYCALEQFFQDGNKDILKQFNQDTVFEFSILSSYYLKEWLGSPTSAISMRVDLLKKILPIPFEPDWITRADDCLVWGASMLSAKKYYYNQPLVGYRIHGNNGFYGKSLTSSQKYMRKQGINKLFGFFLKKSQLNLKSTTQLILLEYKLRPENNLKIFFRYQLICLLSELNLFKKIILFFLLFQMFFFKKIQGN